jgi:hypothetical protein
MENPVTLIEAHQRRVDVMNEGLMLSPNATSLELLQAVYRNPSIDLHVRMRAAMASLPFEHPKLAVTAVVNEQNFAEVLERRLKRIAELEATPLNASKPEIEVKPPSPTSRYRVYSRFNRRF